MEEVRRTSGLSVLLLSEPLPTLTYGRSATRSDLIWTEEMIRSRGITISSVSRGGKWTYHGPGQILIYPIFRLSQLGYPSKAVYRFLFDLRGSVSYHLASLGVSGLEEHAQPFGIYIGERKLVSFGMAIERGISSHGMALYLEDQGAFFDAIHPCGIPNGRVTSLEREGFKFDWESLAIGIGNSIKSCYSYSQ